MTSSPPPQRPPRSPLLLLGLMTTTTIFGPFVIGFTLRGGASPVWPPDRPVEWVAVVGTSAFVLVLMGACVALSFINQRRANGLNQPSARNQPETSHASRPEVEP